jgi:hypothetical protein
MAAQRRGSVKVYSPEFKADAVALYLSDPSHTFDSVGRDLGVSRETPRNWVRAERARRGVPGLRVLVTSRKPLRIGGELLSPMPPLEPPAAVTEGVTEADILASSAARLFLARVGGTPALPLMHGNAQAIALVCRRLDGLPLALELVASRVRTLGLHGLAARLDDRFSVLTDGYRDAPARQRTLHATLAWSWELLTEAERAVLRRLAVHVDGCSPRARGTGLPLGEPQHVGRLTPRPRGEGGVCVSGIAALCRLHALESPTPVRAPPLRCHLLPERGRFATGPHVRMSRLSERPVRGTRHPAATSPVGVSEVCG